MTPPADTACYKNHRFPGEIISHGAWLYYRFTLSYRDVEELLFERGVTVSHEAVRQWCRKFGQEYANRLRHRRPQPGDKWHLAEAFLTIYGERHYLWRAVDQEDNVLDILVQRRRNRQAAKKFFRKLLKGLQYVPCVIITDKLKSYGAAKRGILPGVEHRQSRYLNNQCENSHRPTPIFPCSVAPCFSYGEENMVGLQAQQFSPLYRSQINSYTPCMSMTTYSYRIKDATSRKHLIKMAYAVHMVWNYCQETCLLAWRRERNFLSAYDLHKLIGGIAKDLRLNTDTMQQVCTEYVTRRRQFKKLRLKRRSRKHSLGWIPFKARYVTIDGDTVTYCGVRFRFWLSRPIAGTLKTGSFTQDARGRWYVHFQCEVPDVYGPPAPEEIGIDLGVKDQIACTHLPEPLSRKNLTRHYAAKLAMAQRAHKVKRVKAIHAKITNCRTDWTHKTTTAIATRARLIAVGNVSSPKLAKTTFAKSIYDAVWGMTRTFLQYKAIRLGATYREVPEVFSSLTCSVCLQRTGPRGLSQLGVRAWVCANCGTQHHRDINAAPNHLRTGRGTPQGIPRL